MQPFVLTITIGPYWMLAFLALFASWQLLYFACWWAEWRTTGSGPRPAKTKD